MATGIKPSKVCPKFLHSNSTTHTWVFSAIAELIDNACDTDVRARDLWIDKETINNIECLTFLDNGYGMTPDKLHKMLSFGFSEKEDVGKQKAIGQYGNGFKSGSMRIGQDALVITRGLRSASVGFLSQSYLYAIEADTVLIPVVTWDITPGGLTKKTNKENNLCIKAILDYSIFKSEVELTTQLDELESKPGTKIIIYNLRKDSTGNLELDFVSDPEDIRNPETEAMDPTVLYCRNRQAPTTAPEYRRSLREYCSILYMRPRMTIILRKKKVAPQLIEKSLRKTEVDVYKPQWNNVRHGVNITLGFKKDKSQYAPYGLMTYHNNRLIKAYEKIGIQKKATGEGYGIIAVAEVNFLEPIQNKQDFKETGIYRAFINNAAKKLRDYYEEKTQTKGSAAETIPQDEELYDWVQCDNCRSFRRLPGDYDMDTLPDKWYCKNNPDPLYNRCELPEELEWEDEGEVLPKPTYIKTVQIKKAENKRQEKLAEEKKAKEMEEALKVAKEKKEEALKNAEESRKRVEALEKAAKEKEEALKEEAVEGFQASQGDESSVNMAEGEIQPSPDTSPDNTKFSHGKRKYPDRDRSGERATRARISEDGNNKVITLPFGGYNFERCQAERNSPKKTLPKPMVSTKSSPRSASERSAAETITNCARSELSFSATPLGLHVTPSPSGSDERNTDVEPLGASPYSFNNDGPSVPSTSYTNSSTSSTEQHPSSVYNGTSGPVTATVPTVFVEVSNPVETGTKSAICRTVLSFDNINPNLNNANLAAQDNLDELPDIDNEYTEMEADTDKKPDEGEPDKMPTETDTDKKLDEGELEKTRTEIDTDKMPTETDTGKKPDEAEPDKMPTETDTGKKTDEAEPDKMPTETDTDKKPDEGELEQMPTEKNEGLNDSKTDETDEKKKFQHKGSQTDPPVVKYASPNEMELLKLCPTEQRQTLLLKTRELDELRRNVLTLMKIYEPDGKYGPPENVDGDIKEIIKRNNEQNNSH